MRTSKQPLGTFIKLLVKYSPKNSFDEDLIKIEIISN